MCIRLPDWKAKAAAAQRSWYGDRGAQTFLLAYNVGDRKEPKRVAARQISVCVFCTKMTIKTANW